VAPERFGDHVLVQGVGVVRAQEAEGGCVGEREVEQRLVALTFDELVRLAVGRDRFADAADRPSLRGLLVEEPAPSGDDSGRVRPDLVHVRKQDLVAVAVQLVPDLLDLRRAQNDQDRLPGRDSVEHERHRLLEEAIVSGVEQRFVGELGRAHLPGSTQEGQTSLRPNLRQD
jgi:hypothetical protein